MKSLSAKGDSAFRLERTSRLPTKYLPSHRPISSSVALFRKLHLLTKAICIAALNRSSDAPEPSSMTQNQSYPSPNAAQIGGAAGPFFGQNGGLSPPNMSTDMQLSAELSRAAQPVMSSDANSVQDNGDPGTQLQHHTPIRQEPSPQQVAQGVMSLGEHPHPGFSTPQDAGSSSRKRSKVSRACDECRRKKVLVTIQSYRDSPLKSNIQIRCDASAENVTEACSSCRRTNVCCQFSRQPMKRGPSKGYEPDILRLD